MSIKFHWNFSVIHLNCSEILETFQWYSTDISVKFWRIISLKFQRHFCEIQWNFRDIFSEISVIFHWNFSDILANSFSEISLKFHWNFCVFQWSSIFHWNFTEISVENKFHWNFIEIPLKCRWKLTNGIPLTKCHSYMKAYSFEINNN